MPLNDFHPAVAGWFAARFAAPTESQARAWPAIASRRHTLIAAPTGSGKTLAAFLAAIDDLVRQALAGELSDATQVVYVSPLKALSNDVQRNLEEPLAGIRRELAARGLPDAPIRTLVRTGDTPASVRTAMQRRPPHILVTTPESLFILLTSEGGRRLLCTARTVIVDEIHAVAGNKRGSHLALSLARLEALAQARGGGALTRIGLSATQRPIEEVARFLTGDAGDTGAAAACEIVDTGHGRPLDLGVEIPDSPLEAVMAGEVWQEVYDRLAELIRQHRTTLVFANTRRLVERATRHLADRLGDDRVASHHGSLSREQRLAAEGRLKAGELSALVATASLELGIDIGSVDLVCQLGTTRSVATLLQRVGRAGHRLGAVPKGRVFPTSRDELVEAAALLDAVRRGELDRLAVPERPLDILAQHVVSAVAAEEWREDDLFALVRRAWPYRDLSRADFDAVVAMLAGGFSTRRGRRGAYLHHDAVHGRLRARKGARLAAVTSGGAIPDTADYQVILQPTDTFIGTVHEDFAVESLAGDVFQLGNASWRIRKVEPGKVFVEDAAGQPPTIPFWLGEAPARSAELSQAVSRLRGELAERLREGGAAAAAAWLGDRLGLAAAAAGQLAAYLAAGAAALGVMPTQDTLVAERFFDEAGDMHLVVHAPFGSRINRAWGLALRKRFCQTFNFELQAAASEDAIVLSLGPTHSFPLEDVFRFLHSSSVRGVLTQAVLDSPLFPVRWRWNASRALALPRWRAGRRVPAPLQRQQSEDLIAVVFPDQLACLENIVGEREIPDHPLVEQTLRDCLEEAMDTCGLERLLGRIESGGAALVARDMTEPSPLAHEILNSRPYTFLDDAPLEERRTRAVQARRWLDPETAADLGALDAAAIARVREEAWPEAASADELHDALLTLAFATAREVREAGWQPLAEELAAAGRATLLTGAGLAVELWVAAERLPELLALHPGASTAPALAVPPRFAREWPGEQAAVEVIRGRLQGLGPTTAAALGTSSGMRPAAVEAALAALEAEGFVLRGRFTPGPRAVREDPGAPGAPEVSAGIKPVAAATPGQPVEEWCERRLLARIHRYTLDRLRREIEPVSPADFLRFLLAWQRVAVESAEARPEGPDGLASVLAPLEGFEAPAAAWEGEILPARMAEYDPLWLDALCLAGRCVWGRVTPPAGGAAAGMQGAPPAGARVAPPASAPGAIAGVVADSTSAGAPPASSDSPASSASPVSSGTPVSSAAPAAPRPRRAGPVRATPIALLPRTALPGWLELGAAGSPPDLSANARAVHDLLAARGACFFTEVAEGAGLLHTQVEVALGELVAAGLVSADSFTGLRALLVPAHKRPPVDRTGARRHRSVAGFGMENAGRWSLLRRPATSTGPGGAGVAASTGHGAGASTRYGAGVPAPWVGGGGAATEAAAWALLRRYGVVFHRLLEREALMPAWRDLLAVYRRLEARGEIRGGRFVSGFSGEQFALPEAVGRLRAVRRQPRHGTLVSVSAADPLNLVGIVTPGDRVAALAGNRVLFRDGEPIAIHEGRETRFLVDLPAADRWQAQSALVRRKVAPRLKAYLGRSA
ncbi:MAG TPA: DEAD/DEAH box helicase [Thermoanaerobaculia bacterium]|nr:DEAD/DEAH box helicase [Thermoanaerobaculia bacterium]